MSTENIKKFLQTAYSEEKLSALLAHAQDGKLIWASCCCFIGIVTANHCISSETRAEVYHRSMEEYNRECLHYEEAETIPLAKEAESEFRRLGNDDGIRRERIIPLILEEIQRREAGTTLTKLELAVRYAEMNAGIERSSDSETSDEMGAAVSQGFRP